MYVFLGISNDKLGIIPNYNESAPAAAVYVDTASRIPQADQYLDLLSNVRHEKLMESSSILGS